MFEITLNFFGEIFNLISVIDLIYILLTMLSLIKFPYLIFFGLPFLINKLKKEVFINSFLYISSIIFIYLIFLFSINVLKSSNTLRFFFWLSDIWKKIDGIL